MNGIDNYPGFLLAGIILNLTPGADTIFIITRSVSQGRKAGIYSALGIGTGTIVHTAFAAFGLSILLMKSAMLFNIVKYLGVAYLFYLGFKMITDRSKLIENEKSVYEKIDILKIYRQGFFTNLLNPKVAFFFLSFLPQFINPAHASGPVPFLILGGTFITTGTIWCLFLASTASFVTETLRKNDKVGFIMQKLSGIVFIGLGLQLLFKRNN
jgi:RhtB (resistance to homoserine/threonine) family protein